MLFVASLSFWTLTQAASAGVVRSFQLGEQDFIDGQAPVSVPAVKQAGVGEPYPFDGTVFGDDRFSLGAFTYVHTFDFGGFSPVSATLTLGLLDHDSFPGDAATVAIRFNGVPQPSGALVGDSMPSAASSASVVALPIPLALLAGGKLQVDVIAIRPAPGEAGNSLEPDFSRLTVELDALTHEPLPAPLPPAVISGAVTMIAMEARRMARRSRIAAALRSH